MATYRLKTGVLDYGGGNRLNAIMNTEYRLYPDMFEDDSTFVELVS